ncbi:MAG TPA: NAD(P)H-hydrate dehydratase [Candidatus Angelobacter sp.]|jgi:NAD(P)H-hydrate epimerase|nr:NAD(P)H-hydrate dehydratase [Candidatus Angelobacter sp.]
MKIVTAEEMRVIDRATTEKYGIPSLTLMENAGMAVAEFALKHFDFTSVCAVCGKGNNGGDGFVAARKLHEAGKKVSVIVLAKGPDELRGDAAEMFKKLPVSVLWIADEKDFSKPDIEQALKSDLIIDAILGTGFKPPLKGIAEKAVIRINKADGFVLAVDVPSGIDADVEEPPEGITYVRADAIISFTAAKPALVFANLTDGPIALADIGSPSKLVVKHASLHQDVITSADAQALAWRRRSDAHKGEFGHVLVIGGSVGKSGAAAMAGMAALRAGTGLVTVASPRSVQAAVSAYAPELMTEPMEETAEGTISLLALAGREQLLKGKTVVALGPGLSQNEETAEFIRDFVSICTTSLVIDADGINAFAGHGEEIQADADDYSFRVLTPHPGEMSRLIGSPVAAVQSSRIAAAKRAAELTRACVVLKGHRTIIASPNGHVWINTTGNPGMAKGGSGDVLTGIVAAILAQRPMQGVIVGWRPGKEDPEGMELGKLWEKSQISHDPKLAGEVATKMAAKTREARHLMTTLGVARAVYLHGLAGDIAASLYGQQSMIATDIINCLGEAFAVCEAEALSKFVYLQR